MEHGEAPLQEKPYFVNPGLSTRDIHVMQGEYFWDNDPGAGSGETLIALDGNFNEAIESVFADDISMPSEGTSCVQYSSYG